MAADQPIKYNSQLEKDQSDDSSAPVTKRVILYGWDPINLQKVRIAVDSSGNLQTNLQVDSITTSENLAKVGGANISLGQAVAANSLPVVLASDQSIPWYKTEYDFDSSGTYIYVGEAPPGTAQATSAWRIKKINFDASGNPTSTLLANGTSAFDKAWTHHSDGTYTYTNS